MDSGQVAAAGIKHDDLVDTATSANGGCGAGAGGYDNWTRALLRRGWDLSRKTAIAGVAATAAPVVAPPIIILSVAGVALSFPFAAYLASLAATDRLMSALLPPPRTQPYHTCNLEDDEFLDAPEAPGHEGPVFDYWSEAQDDAIMEKHESYASLPLSREPRLSEELVLASTDEDDRMAEGEFRFQELGHESFVSNNRERKAECTTMEALPRGHDVSRLAAPVLLHDKDHMVQRIVEAPVPAEESVQELFLADDGDKTEDGKCTNTEEMESSKDMLSQGVNITEFQVPMLGNENICVQREGEGEVSVRKAGQDSHVSDTGDKTEELKIIDEMPTREVNVSKLSVPEDGTGDSKKEGEVTVEVMLDEVTSKTDNLDTGEVIHVETDVVTIEVTESQSPLPSDPVAHELQAATNVANVKDIPESVTGDIARDTGDTNTEGVENHSEVVVCSSVSAAAMVTVDDKDLVSSRCTPYFSAIRDDVISVENRPDVHQPDEAIGGEHTIMNEEIGNMVAEDEVMQTEECKTMEAKVSIRDMEMQDIDVSGSSLPDDNMVQSKRVGELTVEMVLEEVTSSTDLVTGEVVDVQMDVIASESATLPPIDLVARELHGVTGAAIFDDIRGSIKDIVKDIGDTNTQGVQHHGEDNMSSRSTPYVSAISDDVMSVEGRSDVDLPHQTTGMEHKATKEGFRNKVMPEDEQDIYTEEQLREQIDTIRTITGYRAVPSPTLEGELAGLYIFVGVEPPDSSRDGSGLKEINTKLRFLKSIIGVE